VCANARASARGALGCARGQEQDVVAREQELARRRESWRLGQRWCNVGKAGAASAGSGRRRQGKGMAQSGAEVVGALHMAGKSGGGASGIEIEEAGAGGGGRGLVCDFPKVQGSYCNV
jgi:hypothetical protein